MGFPWRTLAMAIQTLTSRKFHSHITVASFYAWYVLTGDWNSYAKDLVDIMYGENGPDFGAASDGMPSFLKLTIKAFLWG